MEGSKITESSKVTYHQQVSFCGKARCRRCREGIGHGPYWYAYQTVNGRTVRTYVGKDAPPAVLAAQAEASKIPPEFAHTLVRLYVLGQFRLERRCDPPTPDEADTTNGNARAGSDTPAATGISWENATEPTLQHQRVRALLSCLVSSPGRELAREQVLFTLWPDLDTETAAHRLDRAVHSLRLIFEPGRNRPAASKLLLTEHSTLSLARQTEFWVDADAFENLIARARTAQVSDPGLSEQLLEEAMRLYKGDFLTKGSAPAGSQSDASIDENAIEWVQSRRESLRRTWISLLLELADLRIAREAIPAGIDILDRLLVVDPTNEAAVQRMMALLAQMGRRGEAIQAYQRFALTLKQEFQILPIAATRTLYENILHGRSALTPASNIPPRARPAAHHGALIADAALTQASLPAVVPSHMHIGRPQQSPLVGRDEEMARLHQLLHVTEQTRSLKLAGQQRRTLLTPSDVNAPRQHQCVMLMGDVGMGKTRLAEETAREAKRRDWAVSWCRAYLQESNVPYRLWIEALRRAMSQGLWQRQEVTRRPLVYQPLRILLPELADLLPPARSPIPLPPEQEQLRLWEATRALLSTICENTTLLIVLDDLQWADGSSCEMLTYLVRQMRGLPIMFLCTCRDNELPEKHPMRGMLTDLQREQAIEQIPVRPLSDSEISRLVGHLPEPVVKSVSTRAAGNPFFAEELARDITTQAISAISNPAELPDTIQAVLELRLARISQACQRLLERGSVLGGSFPFENIYAMASGGAPADEEMILDLLEEGLQAGMLVEEDDGSNITYHFWHPLLYTYLYKRLSAARRASLHRKAAQVLQVYYEGREAEGAAEIADHLVKGGSPPAPIARFAELAADRAYTLSAYPDAEKYYLLTLDTLPAPTPASAQDEILHHATILERLGESAMILGKFEDARTFYERVLALRATLTFATPAEQRYAAQIEALIWCEIGQTWRYLVDKEKSKESFQQGEDILLKAKIAGGPAWARIRYQQGHTLWAFEGNNTEALVMAKEALKLFEEAGIRTQKADLSTLLTQAQRILNGDPIGWGKTYILLSGVETFLGKNAEALDHLSQALTVFEQHNIKNEVANACCNLGDLYLKKSEYSLARPLLMRSCELAEEIGLAPIKSVALGNLGVLAVRLGNLTEADTWHRQSLAVAEQVNNPVYISLFNSYVATALIEQGRLEEAVPFLLQALKISRSKRIPFCTGFAFVELGHLRLAHMLAINLQNNEGAHVQKIVQKLCLRATCARHARHSSTRSLLMAWKPMLLSLGNCCSPE